MVSAQTIEVPERLRRRPVDRRGFLVPYFVAWHDAAGKLVEAGEGTPDFRVVDTRKMAFAVKFKRCWLCGEQLGRHYAFVLGPMCTINRIISEPPSHRQCAQYALQACPFMVQPRMRRNEKTPYANGAEIIPAAGVHSGGNPGGMVEWICADYKPVRAHAGHDGVLFEVGEPSSVTWWTEGRHATRAEAAEVLRAGYERLKESAKEFDGPDGVAYLDQLTAVAETFLPPGAP
jgi:hypothetical protein